MEVFVALMNKIDSWIWGLPMLVLLCGTHIFMTFRTGFIQRKTFTGIRLSVTKDPDSPGDVSQFQALTTALASTIGTGNIIGVGTAIYLGGPGAVLWCWLTGVFGIATKYAESLIAVKYRVQTADGRMMGGAMYALERGLKWKKFGKVMAVLFALFAMLASFGIGCGTQINAIAEVLETNLPISLPRIAIGIIFGIITAIIIIGGIESIAVVCEKLVPLMALFYVVGCIVILCANYDFLLPALKAIFVLAFKPGAVTGGLVGGGIRLALQYGVARYGLGAAGCQRGADAQSGAAGARFRDRHLLDDGCRMPDDRSGACLLDDEKSGGQCGKYGKRRSDDHRSIRTDSVYRSADFDGQHHYVRVLHHPRMVVLRRACRRVSARQKGDSAV